MDTQNLSTLIAAFDLVFCSNQSPFVSDPSDAAQIAFATFISAFNRLPRPHVTPCFLGPNHWHFSLRTLLVCVPDIILFMVNPAERYVHVERVPSIRLIREPLELQARVSAVLLLKAFAGEQLCQSRPWSWSTDSPEMATLVSAVMREFGIRDGLEIVRISTPAERMAADEEWIKFFQALVRSEGENKLEMEKERLLGLS